MVLFSPDPSHEDIKHFMDDDQRVYWDGQQGTPEERGELWQYLKDLWRSIPDPTSAQLQEVMGPVDWGHVQRGENRESILNFYRQKWKKDRKPEAISRRAEEQAKREAEDIRLSPEDGMVMAKDIELSLADDLPGIREAATSPPGSRPTPTENDRAKAELLKFMPQAIREAYDKARPEQKLALWEANRQAFENAERRKAQRLLREQKRTGELLEMLQRVREDPSKAHLQPPADASMEELNQWYEKMSKPQRIPDYGNPPDSELGLNFVRDSKTREVRPRARPSQKTRTVEVGEYPNGQVAHTRGWEPSDPLDTPSTKLLVDGVEQPPERIGEFAKEPDTAQAAKPVSETPINTTLPERALNRFWIFRKLLEHPRWSGGGGLILSLIIAKQALDYEIGGAIQTAAFVFLIAWAVLAFAIYVSTIWDKTRLGAGILWIISGALLVVVWVGYLPKPTDSGPKSSPAVATKATAESGQRAVAILPQYEIRVLPILIEVGETSYFLPLNLTLKEGLVSRGNGTTRPMWWPAEKAELKKGGYGIEMVSRCTLKNYSETVLLNPIMRYEISFYEGKSSQGRLISRHTHQVSIPVLEKEKPFIFYIVNQTPYFALVDFPKEIEIEVVGESARRTVPLVQPKTMDQLLQNMPSGQYGPSLIDWTRF